MKQSIKASVFAWIAAAVCLTELLWRTLPNFSTVVKHAPYLLGVWVALAVLVVMLAVRTRIGVLIGAGLYLLYLCFMELRNLASMNFHVYAYVRMMFRSINLYLILAFSLLILLLILSLAKVRAVKYLWFIPAVLAMTGYLIMWVRGRFFEQIGMLWRSMLFGVLCMLELLFIGLWLSALASAQKAAKAPAAPPAPGPAYAPPAAYGKNYPQPPAAPAAAPRFCGRCGGKNDAGNAFCAYCGANLQTPGAPPQ